MKKITLAVLSLASSVCFASTPAPFPVAVNSQSGVAPSLQAFKAEPKTFRVTFLDGTNRANVSAETVAMYWAKSPTTNVYMTSSWSKVNGGSDGVVDFTFSAADLNYPTGQMVYGVVAGSTYKIGMFNIMPSPYGVGVSTSSFTETLNLDMFSIVGGPFVRSNQLGQGFTWNGSQWVFSGGATTNIGTGLTGSGTTNPLSVDFTVVASKTSVDVLDGRIESNKQEAAETYYTRQNTNGYISTPENWSLYAAKTNLDMAGWPVISRSFTNGTMSVADNAYGVGVNVFQGGGAISVQTGSHGSAVNGRVGEVANLVVGANTLGSRFNGFIGLTGGLYFKDNKYGGEFAGSTLARDVSINGHGAMIRGLFSVSNSATNDGNGSIILVDNTGAGHAYITSTAGGSILLGNGTLTNRHSIKAAGTIEAAVGLIGPVFSPSVLSNGSALVNGTPFTNGASLSLATNGAWDASVAEASGLAQTALSTMLSNGAVSINDVPLQNGGNIIIDTNEFPNWLSTTDAVAYRVSYNVPIVNSTATISAANGRWQRLMVPTNTIVTADVSSKASSNNFAAIVLSLYPIPAGSSLTFNTNTISSGITNLVLSTSSVNVIVFMSPAYESSLKWRIGQFKE